MPRIPRRPLLAAVAIAASAALAPAAQVVHAGAQPAGAVLVPGYAWAGADASMGDLNVYSDGSTYDGYYQCTELVMRYATVRFNETPFWPATSAADFWRVGPLLPVPFTQFPNGGAVAPQYGDIIVYNVTPQFPYGHVAIVSGTGPGYVSIVEENASWTGRATLPIQGTYMPPRPGSGQPVIGWLRADAGPYVPNPSMPGGQILDAWGGLHPYGSADLVRSPSYWPGWSIGRDVATLPHDPDSGYVLDGWGGLHPFGHAAPVQLSGYWKGWDIARSIVLRADGQSGYVLDGWGVLHPFGVRGDMPPKVTITAYWPGWDIAKAAVLRSDGVSGYVLDGFGGVHPFGPDGALAPATSVSTYWQGWNIARGIALTSDGGGYVVDGFGGVHPFGNAQDVTLSAYFGGHDVARGVVVTGSTSGYVLYASGVIRPFGTAQQPNFGLMGLALGTAAAR